MLVSLFVKEKLYIGEASMLFLHCFWVYKLLIWIPLAVATICGIIFGPYGAGWLDPGTWGNVDQITLEASRIVLVVQCFAVGVELPKVCLVLLLLSMQFQLRKLTWMSRNIWNVTGSLS